MTSRNPIEYTMSVGLGRIHIKRANSEHSYPVTVSSFTRYVEALKGWKEIKLGLGGNLRTPPNTANHRD